MLDLVQGSKEWLDARAGSLGASQVADVIAKTKSGWSASRGNVLGQLVRERLTGKPTQSFSSAAMQRGLDLEPQARAMYSFETGSDVVEVGIVPHPTIQGTHASPDGLVGETGLVEIKCCEDKRHYEIISGAKPEGRYVSQCLWQMACTGREWVDLSYFNPDWPSKMQLMVHRIERDTRLIKEITGEVMVFLREVDETVADLKARYQA